MHTFVLQDWITIRGQSGTQGQTITQSQQDWLDLSPFQDVFFWVIVTETTPTGASNGLNLIFETSPTDDEALFQSLLGGGATPTPAISNIQASPTPTIIKLPMLSATVPLARYLRWKLTGPASTWDVTMRIVVAANSPGM